MLLKLLEDKNGEVQNLAVKWYVKQMHFKYIEQTNDQEE